MRKENDGVLILFSARPSLVGFRPLTSKGDSFDASSKPTAAQLPQSGGAAAM